MKKIEEYLRRKGVAEKKISFYVEKVIKFLAIAIVIGILFIFSQLAIFYGIFAWIGTQIRVLTGLDEFITKGIAFLVMALFFGTPLGGFIWSFTPIPQKKKDRRKKRVIFLVVLAALCFISFFASRNVYFNVRTGEAEKYYSVGIDGEYVFYSSPGFDPITGDELRPVTKDVMENHLKSLKEKPLEEIVKFTPEMLANLPMEKIGNGEMFYPVTFKNDSYRNLRLFISNGSNPKAETAPKKLNSGESKTFAISEGIHFFILVDASDNIRGARQGGKLLTLGYDAFIFPVGGRFMASSTSFRLDVVNLDGQVITIGNNEVLHSRDLNSAQREESERLIREIEEKEQDREYYTKLFGFGIPGLMIMVFLYSALAVMHEKEKNQKNF